jgi:hypothetical protein
LTKAKFSVLSILIFNQLGLRLISILKNLRKNIGFFCSEILYLPHEKIYLFYNPNLFFFS